MTDRDKNFQQALSQGHSAAWDQNWDQAAQFYRQAISLKPGDIKATGSLGLALYELHEYKEALKCYRQVAESSPTDPIPLEKIASLYEFLGNPKVGAQAAVRAAELYLKNEDLDKAIENWSRAVGMDPEHLGAHSRLAVVYERINRIPQAVREYLHITSLMQHAGKIDRAVQAVNRALKIAPQNEEAQQALVMLREEILLPKPARPQGGTGPIQPPPIPAAKLKLTEEKIIESDTDPIEEAQSKAIAALATLFFEQSSEEEQEGHRDLRAIVKGTGPLFAKNIDKTKLMLHLGQAVEALSQGDQNQAAENLKQVIDTGLHHSAAYFSLGYLWDKTDRLESAVRYLKRASGHADYALAARLVLGNLYRKKGQIKEASIEYLEALSLADSKVVPRPESDRVRQLYEPIIEAHAQNAEDDKCAQLCDTIKEMLIRPKWHSHLSMMRKQLVPTEGNEPPAPIAQVLAEASSSQVVVAMSKVRELARESRYQAALEEALFALQDAPTYLPLHITIGDLLVSGKQFQAAIDKFIVVARSYSVRGETARSIDMLRRVVDMSPMDLAARYQLIQELVARGEAEEAIKEYVNLAEVHYSLAELVEARKTYSRALQYARESGSSPKWRVRILHRIADIDVQSLNWRQALDIYQQVCAIQPDDVEANRHLVDLNFRLGEKDQALTQMRKFINFVSDRGQIDAAIQFLESVIKDWPQQAMLRSSLANSYQLAGRTEDAVTQFDMAGEILLETGDKYGAIQMIKKIISLEPANVEKYQQLVARLQQN